MATAVLFVAAGLFCGSALAQWKWRDKNGQITISDLPPPRDIAEKDVLQRPSQATAQAAARPKAPTPAASAPASAPARIDPELEARRKLAEQERDAQRKQEEDRVATQRAENCRRAQSYLRTLESGMRVARANEKGEREVLDDAQRAQEERRAREAIALNCR